MFENLLCPRRINPHILILTFFLLSLAFSEEPPFHQLGGYGTGTKGGLAGRIIKVTNLKSDGPGSLRAACEEAGERLIIFQVGGVIDLEKRPIKIKNPFITIAGQTSPHPGITLVRGGIQITTHDVVIQHIAVRPGEAGEAKGSGWEVDGMATWGANAYNIVFDHCSATWATDENLSVSGPPDSFPGESSHDVTLYGCLIAESLSHSTHSKGEHGKGSLLNDGASNISIIGCLYAHNNRRNPLLKGNTRAVLVNNIIYNSGSQCIGMTDRGKSPYIGKSSAVFVGNVWITGANSSKKTFVSAGQPRICGDAYFSDNHLEDHTGKSINLTLSDVFIKKMSRPSFWPEGLVARPVSHVVPHVLRTVGARAGDRDAIDDRIVLTIIEGSGSIIDSEQQVGGYPEYDATYQVLQVPSTQNERLVWLDSLAAKLSMDSTLDVTPLPSNVFDVNGMHMDNLPDEFQLRNYPNPFNPETTITFSIPEAMDITLRIYNIRGELVNELQNGRMASGSHNIKWYGTNQNGQQVGSGVFIYTLESPQFSASGKMILMR